MLNAKYKAHRFVNIVFYLMIFIIGFGAGFGFKKIDFNTIFSKLFFIDNVYAYESENLSVTYSDVVNNVGAFDSSATSEQYIYNLFEYVVSFSNLNLDFIDYSNVVVAKTKNSNSSFYYHYCTNSIPIIQNYGNNYYIGANGSCLVINKDNNSLISKYYTNLLTSDHIRGINNTSFDIYTTGTAPFNYISLNFDIYTVNNMGEIFDNDPNHTYIKHCWNFNKETYFIITPKDEVLANVDFSAINKDNQLTYNTGFFAFGNFGFSNTTQRGYLVINPASTSSLSVDYSYVGFRFNDLQDITNNFAFLNSNELLSMYYALIFQPIDTQNNNSYFYDNISKLLSSHYLESTYHLYSEHDKGYNVFKYSPNCAINSNNDSMTCNFQYTTETYTNISQNKPAINGNVCIYTTANSNVSILSSNSEGGLTGIIDNPRQENTTLDPAVSQFDEYDDYYDFFFNSLPFEDYGLSSVLYAPLHALDNAVTGTCEPVSIPILSTSISLPCGDTIFWNREDVQPFKTFWNLFLGGILCYGIGISILKTIKNIKDPNHDKLEVIDL